MIYYICYKYAISLIILHKELLNLFPNIHFDLVYLQNQDYTLNRLILRDLTFEVLSTLESTLKPPISSPELLHSKNGNT